MELKSKKKILIIDSDAIFSKTLDRFLRDKRESQYDVFTLNETDHIIKTIKEMNPDLVVLELAFANISALDLYKRVRSCDPEKKMKILILTKRAELEDIFEGMEADSFIAKTAPFDVNYLLREIDMLALNKKIPVIYLLDNPNGPFTKDIRRKLRKQGYRTLVIEGLGAFMTNIMDVKPTMILMEYDLKDIVTGQYMIKKIKEIVLQLNKTIWNSEMRLPIIVFTITDANYKAESLTAGADFYIGKLTGTAPLLEKVSEVQETMDERLKELRMRKIMQVEGSEPKDKPSIDGFKVLGL